MLRYFILIGSLCLAHTAYGQTVKGAKSLHFEGSIARIDGEASADIESNLSYMLLDRLSVGIGVGFSKIPKGSNYISVGGRAFYHFNGSPGDQKMVPRFGLYSGINSGGGGSAKYVGGAAGVRYFLNPHVGLSTTGWYEKVLDAPVGMQFITFGFSTSTYTVRDDISNIGISWGIFFQFGVE